MYIPETEDPELDFTNFMEQQKAKVTATTPVREESKQVIEPNTPLPPGVVRGTVFFTVLLVLLGVLIVLYINRPQSGKLIVPAGYIIIEKPNTPPSIGRPSVATPTPKPTVSVSPTPTPSSLREYENR